MAEPSYRLPLEIRDQVAAIRGSLSDKHRDSILEASQSLERDPPDLMCMVGVGDSLYASMCAQYYFARWGNRMIHAMDALEFSHHLYRAISSQSAVFALSYSGETVRTLEACIAAKSRNAHLFALTRDLNSSMANMADHVIPNQSHLERSNCRTGSFQSMHLSLLLLALATNPSSDAEDTAIRVIHALEYLVEHLLDYVDAVAPEMEQLSRRLDPDMQFFFLGGGVGWPLARYGSSKLYETASLPSIASELEQFAHCEVFSLNLSDCVVIIAQDGPSFSRAGEVADAVREIGSSVWGLSDNPAFQDHCDHFTLWPKSEYEELSIVPAAIPLQWFAYYRAIHLGNNPDRVRHKDVNSPLIRESPYLKLEDYRRG